MAGPPNQVFAWYEGQILPFDSLLIPATDLALEHGLGLFESIRAESGKIPLWEHHVERLCSSASALLIPFQKSQLPTMDDIRQLLSEAGLENRSCRLRLVLTAGSPTSGSRIWLTAHPLETVKKDGLILAEKFWPVDPRDALVRFKTLNYWSRRRAFETATASGADETLSQDPFGNLWEGARTSLFLVQKGQLVTPETNGPYLKSVAATALNELLQKSGPVEQIQKRITVEDLRNADEILLLNAVRGIMSVGSWQSQSYQSPGPVVQLLRQQWQASYF
jgi:branched-subunit amino acid aminotransferase/4-amino-4-deoxychorismate lyase